MVRAVNRSLHKAETSLSGVDMQEMAKPDVFVRTVIDGAVASEFLTG
jgi:hypothetical protein